MMIDPTARSDPGGSDQTSEDIDTVMDAKGWTKCTDSNRWSEEYPWNKDKGQNQCRWAKEWDEYRHYLITKNALDICDETNVDWHPMPEPAGFAVHACTFCYKSQDDKCVMDGGYTKSNVDGTFEAKDTDIWFQNAPRNLAECSGSPPVCPGNPPIGHVGDFPLDPSITTTTAATTTTTTTTAAPTTTTAAPTTTTVAATTAAANATTAAANATTTAGTGSSALVAGATSLLFGVVALL